MAILSFQKPDKIVLQKANDFEGQFEFRPLEPGFGLTIGNALRRVLLSSLEGFAIVGIKIEGVDHEFATIKGVTEDVTEIILNLKQVRLKNTAEGEPQQMTNKAGETRWTPAGLHLPENTGDQPFEVILVELKSKPVPKTVKKPAPPAATPKQ